MVPSQQHLLTTTYLTPEKEKVMNKKTHSLRVRSRNVTPLRHHLPADIALLCFNAVLRLAAVCSMFCSCHVLRFNVLHFGVLHCGKVNAAGLLGEK